jgi:hypothetical protein
MISLSISLLATTVSGSRCAAVLALVTARALFKVHNDGKVGRQRKKPLVQGQALTCGRVTRCSLSRLLCRRARLEAMTVLLPGAAERV